MSSWPDRYQSALMNTFGPPQRVLVRGRGCEVWDDDGRRYLDLLAGIAVNALGHAHPDWVAAVSDQAATLAHVSNFFATPPQIELAERLLALAQAPPDSRVFLTNSGTEAIEAAIKLARVSGERRIIALEGSFHGRTLGALALTHKAAYREPFAPLPGPVEWVPPGDIAALEQAFAAEAVAERGPVAAVFAEVIQGEAGVRLVPPEFLQRARELTRAHRLPGSRHALLVIDEVQTGIGRTGHWFASRAIGLEPDVITLAKGLGGGFPIGAVLAFGEAGARLTPGQHGTTFGGNPLAARAALAVLNVIERDGLLANATQMGSLLRAEISGVRGAGLLLAVETTDPAAVVVQKALAAGLIINAVTPTAIRLAPPLIITEPQVREAAATLKPILGI